MDRRVKECLRQQAQSVRSLDHHMDTCPQTRRTLRSATSHHLHHQVTNGQSLGCAGVGQILSSRVSQTPVRLKFKCPGSRSAHASSKEEHGGSPAAQGLAADTPHPHARSRTALQFMQNADLPPPRVPDSDDDVSSFGGDGSGNEQDAQKTEQKQALRWRSCHAFHCLAGFWHQI